MSRQHHQHQQSPPEVTDSSVSTWSSRSASQQALFPRTSPKRPHQHGASYTMSGFRTKATSSDAGSRASSSADQQSWISAPPSSSSKMESAASRFTTRQQQQKQKQHATQQQPTTGTAHQHFMMNQFGGSPTSSSSKGKNNNNTASSSNSGAYRPDYSRSQHRLEDSPNRGGSGARSEPILTEQDRFAAYVNRFAQVDPRMEYDVSSTSGPNNNHNSGFASPQQQKSATRQAVRNLEQRLHGNSNSNNNRKLSSKMPQQPQQSQSKNKYRRQGSSNSAEAARTSSSVVPKQGGEQQQQPLETEEDRAEFSTTMSDMGRTTASSSTRRTRPSANRYPQHYQEEEDDDEDEEYEGDDYDDFRIVEAEPQPNDSHQTRNRSGYSAAQQQRIQQIQQFESSHRGRKQQRGGDQAGTIELSSRGRSPSSREEVVERAARSLSLTQRGNSNMEDTTQSPGTNRTKDLARRFEERMHAKGRSAQLQSAMQSAYSQHKLYHGGDLDEKKEGDEGIMMMRNPQQPYYSDAPNIETPLPASVKDLKEKLWDDKGLNVRVRPTLPYHEDDSIGPRGRASDGHSIASSSQQQQQQQLRQTRSLSPKTSRRAYETTNPQHYNISSPTPYYYNSQQQQQPLISSSDVASTRSASSGGSGGLRFKSKYFEAAALATPEWVASSNKSESSAERDRHNTTKNPASMRRRSSPPPSGPSSSGNSSLNAPQLQHPQATQDDDPPISQASTPKMINHDEHNVSLLLRKLHSINRQNPSQALAEIDEILKEEAMRDDPDMQRALRIPEEYMLQQQQLDHAPEEYESDSETTVSSITNPTYQGGSGNNNKKRDESPTPSDEKRPQTHHNYENDRNPLDMPEDLQNGGGYKSVDPALAENAKAGERLLRMSRSRPPPPSAAHKNNKEKDGKSNNDSEEEEPQPTQAEETRSKNVDPRTPQRPPTTKVLGAESVERLRLDDIAKSNSEELALKIRRWDELSGKDDTTSNASRGKPAQAGPAAGAEDLGSNSTEGLGSIITPQQQQQQQQHVPPRDVSPHRHHPWDAKPPAVLRETSQNNAEGVEAVEAPEIPYSPRQERLPKPKSPVTAQHSMNLSNDFDDAWVALPTSKFFPTNRLNSDRSLGSKSPSRGERRGSDIRPLRRVSGGEFDDEDDTDLRPVRRVSGGRFDYDNEEEQQQSSKDFTRREPSPVPAVRRNRTLDLDLGRDDDPSVAEELEVTNTDFKATASANVASSNSKPKKGLRALLQRGNRHDHSNNNSHSRSNQSAAASVSTSVVANARRVNQNNEEVPPPPQPRGRRNNGGNDVMRSRSLEERRPRNPNIAKKFSRMLRVYGNDEVA